MSPGVIAEEGASAIEGLRVVLRDDPTIWLSVLGAGLLIVVVVGMVLVTRHQRQREQRATGGSITDWGQSLALASELRREIKRLSEENQRLWEDRAELVTLFAHVVELLQQEVGQISKSHRVRSERPQAPPGGARTRPTPIVPVARHERSGPPGDSERGRRDRPAR